MIQHPPPYSLGKGNSAYRQDPPPGPPARTIAQTQHRPIDEIDPWSPQQTPTAPGTFQPPTAGFSSLPVEMIEAVARQLHDDADLAHLGASDSHLRRSLFPWLEAVQLERDIKGLHSGSALLQAMHTIEFAPRSRRHRLWQTALARLAELAPAQAATVFDEAEKILATRVMGGLGQSKAGTMSQTFDLLGDALRHLCLDAQLSRSLKMLNRWAPIYSPFKIRPDAYAPCHLLCDIDIATLQQHYPLYLKASAAFPAIQQKQMILAMPVPTVAHLPPLQALESIFSIIEASVLLQAPGQAIMMTRLQWETYDLLPAHADIARDRIHERLATSH